MKLYVYSLEDVEDDNFDNVKAIDVISGKDNAECEKTFEDKYCSNDYGCTYCEMPLKHGGFRPGAGRPSTGRKKVNYYVTDQENIKIKEYIKNMREENKMLKNINTEKIISEEQYKELLEREIKDSWKNEKDNFDNFEEYREWFLKNNTDRDFAEAE